MIFRSNRCSSCFIARAIADWVSHKESPQFAHKPHSLTQRLTSTTRGRERLVMERESECICRDKEREKETSSQGGQSHRACHVFRMVPPPSEGVSNVRGEERSRDVQRMRERENRDRHKLRVSFTIFSLFFSMSLGWGLNSTTSDQDITKSQMGVVTPTYPT